MHYYAIMQMLVTDGGGHWYEIGEVQAPSREEAIRTRWPDGKIPYGYRVVMK